MLGLAILFGLIIAMFAIAVLGLSQYKVEPYADTPTNLLKIKADLIDDRGLHRYWLRQQHFLVAELIQQDFRTFSNLDDIRSAIAESLDAYEVAHQNLYYTNGITVNFLFCT